MTTIAYDGRFICADTRVTTGKTMILPEHAQKFVISDEGHVGLSCGSISSQVTRFFDWVRAGCPEGGFSPSPEVKAEYIVFYPDGRCFQFDPGGPMEIKLNRGIYAWGSGEQFALGAMAYGASAYDAIKVAMQFDCWTGGDITMHEVKWWKPKAAPKVAA